MATPMAPGRRSRSWRWASSSSGVGAARTSAGMTRSGRSYRRSKCGRRPAAVTRPAAKRYSSAGLPSRQPHHGPPFSPPSSSSLGGERAAFRDLLVGPPRRTRRTVPSRRLAAPRPRARSAPSASATAGAASIGRNDATWPQYSNISPVALDVLLEQRPRVRAEPGEERELVRAGQHVDRVDLHHAQPVEDPRQMAAGDRPGRRRIDEPLRRRVRPAAPGPRQPQATAAVANARS